MEIWRLSAISRIENRQILVTEVGESRNQRSCWRKETAAHRGGGESRESSHVPASAVHTLDVTSELEPGGTPPSGRFPTSALDADTTVPWWPTDTHLKTHWYLWPALARRNESEERRRRRRKVHTRTSNLATMRSLLLLLHLCRSLSPCLGVVSGPYKEYLRS